MYNDDNHHVDLYYINCIIDHNEKDSLNHDSGYEKDGGIRI